MDIELMMMMMMMMRWPFALLLKTPDLDGAGDVSEGTLA